MHAILLTLAAVAMISVIGFVGFTLGWQSCRRAVNRTLSTDQLIEREVHRRTVRTLGNTPPPNPFDGRYDR